MSRVKKYPMDSLSILLRISKPNKQGLTPPEIAEALRQKYPQTVESPPLHDSPHHPATSSSPAILHTLTRIADTLDRLEPQQEDVTDYVLSSRSSVTIKTNSVGPWQNSPPFVVATPVREDEPVVLIVVGPRIPLYLDYWLRSG